MNGPDAVFVASKTSLATYVIRDGFARKVGTFTMLPVDIPEGRYVCVGDHLGIEVDGRTFLVALDTCAHCNHAVEDGIKSGDLVFCDDVCREEWRWNRS